MFIFTIKSKKIKELYHEGKSYSEIASLTNSSFTQIKKVIDKEKREILHNEVVRMKREGKTFEEISRELDLTKQEIQIIIEKHIASNIGDRLCQFYYDLINSSKNPIDFLEFSYYLFQKKFTVQKLESLDIFQQGLDDHIKHFNHLIDENIKLEDENSRLKNINSILAQQILDQKRTIQNNIDKINQLKNEEKN